MRIHNLLPEARNKMERIYNYVCGAVEDSGLSDDEKALLERCNFADDLLRQRHTDSAVVRMLRLKFGVSQATAYNDVATTKYIFSSIPLSEKEYGLKLMLELNMKVIQKCMEKGDYKIVRELQETRLKIFDRIKGVDELREELSGNNRQSNTFILRVSVSDSGGRPRDLDMMKDIQDLGDDEVEMINNRVNSAFIPDSLIAQIKKTDE